jgi:hypothetical protein
VIGFIGRLVLLVAVSVAFGMALERRYMRIENEIWSEMPFEELCRPFKADPNERIIAVADRHR